MHRTRFDHLTLEFDLNGHHYRTEPADLIAVQVDDTTPAPVLDAARYALRKGLGVWHLTFAGHDITLKHERGIFYIAWLLDHPEQTPIHALDLISKIPAIYRQHLGLTEIADPATGAGSVIASHARLQERSLSLDDAQTLRALLRKQKELEAILDDPNESEPVRAEALCDLEAIADFEREHAGRSVSNAQRAADAVHKAITRFHRHLAEATDATGNPHPLLTAFAAYLEKHVLVPSRRYAAGGNRFARTGLSGCFTYEPPER
jgi:hypothetical protein